MTQQTGHSPSWAREIAQSLENYLREAAAFPAPAGRSAASADEEGWYTQPPHGALSGRTPWIHLADITVSCVEETIVVSFRWLLDDPAGAPRYLLPLTTTQTDTATGADELITRLDLFLDSGTWQAHHAYPIGNRISVVAIPERTTPGSEPAIRDR